MEKKTLQIVFSNDVIHNVILTDEDGNVNELLSDLLQIGPPSVKNPQEISTLEHQTVSNNLSLLLNHLGLSPNLKGYYYIKCAVIQVMQDPALLVGITKKLYPDIAEQYHTTTGSVERSIRHAIQIVWRDGNKELFRQLTHRNIEEKPTNSQFIGILAEVIKIEKIAHTVTV